MSIPETSTTPLDRPEVPAPGPSPTPLPPAGRLWTYAIAGAIVAAIVTYAALEAIPTAYIPPKNMIRIMGQLVNQPKLADVNVADRKNAMLAFGAAGGALAMALGLAGGAARRSAKAAIVGGLSGLVVGTALGVATAAVTLTIFQTYHDRDPQSVSKEMTVPLLVHAALWASVGAAGAFALGIGAGARWRMASVVLGGLIGGAIGGGIYEVIAAMFWSYGRSYQPIAAHWQPRLLAAMAGPLMATFVAVSGLVSEPRRPKSAAATPEAGA